MKRTNLRLFFRKVTNWLIWFSDWLWEESEYLPFSLSFGLARKFSSQLPVGNSLTQVVDLDSDGRISLSDD